MGVGSGLDVLLRSARIQAGLSQGELAARAGVTRQAISAIETGKAAPTMPVALRLARVVGRRVDELFRLVDELPRVTAELVGMEGRPLDVPVRVQVADVGGRLIARPLSGMSGATLTLPRANGLIASQPRAGDAAVVDLFVDPQRVAGTVVAVGCDPAMGL